jgi:competence protein ComFC
MHAAVEQAGMFVKDCLFPVHCLDCGVEGTWACAHCFRAVDWTGVFCCPLCREDTLDGRACVGCRDASALCAMGAASIYDESWLIGGLMRTWKYHFVADIFRFFAAGLDQFFSLHQSAVHRADIIVPVPLHPRRYAARGFNQAEVVAEYLGACLNIPVVPCLVRQRFTSQQARLTRLERRDNVADAFRVAYGEKELRGLRVLLVDDVYTTGSTMQECARILGNAGTKSVSGFALARG